MPDLRQRSQVLELLDGEVSQAELWQNLVELDTINHWLGGHRATLGGLEQLIGPQRPWTLVDIGCGGGDSLAVIQAWAAEKGIEIALTGVDLKADCLSYAQKHVSGPIEWICADYRRLDRQWDLVISSLFCHHLNETELLDFLLWMRHHAQFAYLINDLHRHPLAYHSIALLTQFFSRSALVKHDAPLSVWRGFTHAELKKLCQQAELMPQIKWIWAFRYLVYGYV